MYTKETNNPLTIVFYYPTVTLFNEVKLRTMYRARNLKDKNGVSQIEDFGLSKDETDAFNTFMKKAIYNAYDMFVKLTTGISVDPVFVDKAVDINGTATDNISGFRILDHNAYNPNVLFGIDDGVFQYIRYSVLADWYALTGLMDEAALWLKQKEEIMFDLKANRLFQLRKPLIS